MEDKGWPVSVSLSLLAVRSWVVHLLIKMEAKPENETVETRPAGMLMRSQEDDLTIWQSVCRFKRIGIIAMVAAFSASLDGYRECGGDKRSSANR